LKESYRVLAGILCLNKVSSIYSVASEINSMVNGGKVGVVHGQMTRDQIEDVMMKFYNGELNIFSLHFNN
jgi:transcription-repair coupling factor (superfamily II helicase)